MEKKPTRPMTPFDEITIPAGLQAIKLLLPYTPESGRHTLAFFIKFMELQNTIQIFRSQSQCLQGQVVRSFPPSPEEILENISPYLPPESAAMLDNFRNLLNMMDMLQMLQEMGVFSRNEQATADTDEETSEEASSIPFQEKSSTPTQEDLGRADPMEFLLGMLSSEQKENFQMLKSMFSGMNSSEKDSSTEFDNKKGSETL